MSAPSDGSDQIPNNVTTTGLVTVAIGPANMNWLMQNRVLNYILELLMDCSPENLGFCKEERKKKWLLGGQYTYLPETINTVPENMIDMQQ
jgi:hypothetical protein